MEIVSKRHPYKFYLLLILVNILFIGAGTLFIILYTKENESKHLLYSLIFFAFAFYTDYIFIKNSRIIILNKKGFFFKKEFYDWNDVVDIKLTGKSGLFLNTPTECATLNLKNSNTIRIFDNFYSNSSEIKYFIQEIVINKKETIEKQKNINSIDIVNEFLVSYKGNPIFSFRGIFMWGLIVFALVMPLLTNKPFKWDAYPVLIGFCFFWFFMNSLAMNYFEISKNYFVVKNHYFFWKNDIYSINEIKEVVYEQQSKQPNNLRLITNHYKSKLYPAGSLTDSTWIKMKKDLENKHILVRNECIPE